MHSSIVFWAWDTVNWRVKLGRCVVPLAMQEVVNPLRIVRVGLHEATPRIFCPEAVQMASAPSSDQLSDSAHTCEEKPALCTLLQLFVKLTGKMPNPIRKPYKMTVTEETVTEESENEHWKYRSRLQTNFMGPSKM